ncbi:GTPase IMAP family member 4-like [Astatotilapia calliptera]|uniref:GTPase IMAP family member 4-like n=1 Tax=Astatotilapia calliptera TaxID=8154 RepID=UPI000E40F742|nr:GTPase IMAP family member 4-like [Astatotilapia calliptera]
MYRIVLLGGSKSGKSSLANSVLGEDVFKVDNTECQTESKSLHGRRITLINTPDFSGPGRSEEELKPEILRCITECTPGPHAFLIVLKVEKSTEQQQQKAVIEKIRQYFSEEVFKYAAVVFIQDGPDSDEMKMKDFIDQNKYLSDLMRKCKSRYHIINKYSRQGDISQSQVTELLNTVDQIVAENKDRCYTSKMLPQGDTHNKANNSVSKNKMIKLTGCAAKSVAKAFSGPAVVVLTPGTTNGAEELIGQKEPISEVKNKGSLTEMTSKVDGKTTKKTGEEGGKTKEDPLLQGEREDGNVAQKAGGLECFIHDMI